MIIHDPSGLVLVSVDETDVEDVSTFSSFYKLALADKTLYQSACPETVVGWSGGDNGCSCYCCP